MTVTMLGRVELINGFFKTRDCLVVAKILLLLVRSGPTICSSLTLGVTCWHIRLKGYSPHASLWQIMMPQLCQTSWSQTRPTLKNRLHSSLTGFYVMFHVLEMEPFERMLTFGPSGTLSTPVTSMVSSTGSVGNGTFLHLVGQRIKLFQAAWMDCAI